MKDFLDRHALLIGPRSWPFWVRVVLSLVIVLAIPLLIIWALFGF